jgi:hypothetical protein
MAVTWEIQTPMAPAALAVVQLRQTRPELDQVLARLGLPVLDPGQVKLANLLNVDNGVIARWSDSCVHLFPHGGPAVLRELARALTDAGVPEHAAPPQEVYPEASSLLEARMLHALARAASPIAIDLLLAQPRRWAEHSTPDPAEARHALLNRLIEPPLVVAIGPSNVGKSSLLNALAGRGISLVADQPGTTRDHVGALIDMAGLVVRYIDTPGIRPDAPDVEAEAVQLAAAIARNADLILSCGDITAPPATTPPGIPALHLALRADLGAPDWPYDLDISLNDKAGGGRGLPDLVILIRDRLVPPPIRADPRPWVFWPALQGPP